jgi:hypothetical protein
MDHYADGLLGSRMQSPAGIRTFVSRYITGQRRTVTVLASDETLEANRSALRRALNRWIRR